MKTEQTQQTDSSAESRSLQDVVRPPVRKVVKDGKVAVLYAPGYGAGWSTWNGDDLREYLVFDGDLVECVLRGDKAEAARLAEKQKDYVCVLGADDLKVAWVDEGSRFEIDEYDGSESIHVIGGHDYLAA